MGASRYISSTWGKIICESLISAAEVSTYIFVSEAVTHRCQQLTEAILRDVPVVVLVEAAESVLDDILRVGALEAFAEKGQEHCEVDWSGRLVHHCLEILVVGVLAQRGQHVVKVLLLNEAIAILIDHVEGLLEFGDLSLVEHGEHIGRRSLGTFLGGGATGCSFT